MIFTRCSTIGLLLGLLVFTIGCGGSKDGKYLVSGTVTWEGEPVPEGNIIFHSVDPSVGPDADSIENGTFSFRVSAGKKTVEILATRDIGKPDPIMKTVAREQYLPARYNKKTELTSEVKPEITNDFSFDLVTGDSSQSK